MPHLGVMTVLVHDYDDALRFYLDALGFELVEDLPLPDGSRWVVVRPVGTVGTGVLLARADTAAERERVGAQTGERVFLFLHTDDFARDHQQMSAAGVRFLEEPRHEAYGTVAVFEDLYGNRFDLIQPS